MTITRQVWNALTDEQRWERLVLAEDIRELFPAPRPDARTAPADWHRLDDDARFSLLARIEFDLANRRYQAAMAHSAAPQAAAKGRAA